MVRQERIYATLTRIWTTVLMIILLWLCLERGKRTSVFQYETDLPSGPLGFDGMQFVNAGPPYTHYVGRWTRRVVWRILRFAMDGSNTILLSLRNLDPSDPASATVSKAQGLSFLPSDIVSSLALISLVACIDEDDYIVLPDASSMVLIRKGDMEQNARHENLIIAPLIRNVIEDVQVEGFGVKNQGNCFLSNSSRQHPLLQSMYRTSSHTSYTHSLIPPEDARDRDRLVRLDSRKRQVTGTARSIFGGVGSICSARCSGLTMLLWEWMGCADCIGGRGSPAGLANGFLQKLKCFLIHP